MTTTTTSSFIEYDLSTGFENSSTYSYNFQILEDDHIKAVFKFDSDSADLTFALLLDYTVTINNSSTGGAVQFTAAAVNKLNAVEGVNPSGTLRLLRDTPVTQIIDWVNNGLLDLEVLEESFDKVTLILQEFNDQGIDINPEIISDALDKYYGNTEWRSSYSQIISHLDTTYPGWRSDYTVIEIASTDTVVTLNLNNPSTSTDGPSINFPIASGVSAGIISSTLFTELVKVPNIEVRVDDAETDITNLQTSVNGISTYVPQAISTTSTTVGQTYSDSRGILGNIDIDYPLSSNSSAGMITAAQHQALSNIPSGGIAAFQVTYSDTGNIYFNGATVQAALDDLDAAIPQSLSLYSRLALNLSDIPDPAQARANLGITNSGVSDGDKGDITVSSSGTVWSVDLVSYTPQTPTATSTVLSQVFTDSRAAFPDVTINFPLATSSFAGILSAANFTKLEGIEALAEVNPTDSEIVTSINTELGNTDWQTPGSGGVTDGDKGDIIVSSSGDVWTFDYYLYHPLSITATATTYLVNYLDPRPGKFPLGFLHQLATSSTAGIMPAASFSKLEGIATGATANDTDSNLKNRANHTGTQTLATISDAGSAASSSSSDFATAAQGALADTALQSQKVMFGIAVSDETTDLTTGTAKTTFRAPSAFDLTSVRASVTTAPIGASISVDISVNGVSIFTTALSIDSTEKTSTTAATAHVLTSSPLAIADDAEITVDIDAVGSTTAGAGLKIVLIGDI